MSNCPFDRALFGRIKEYVSTREYVDINEMAEDLKKIYPGDYRRRNQNAFRMQCERFYDSLLKEGVITCPSIRKKKNKSKEGSTPKSKLFLNGRSDENLVEYKDTNTMNKMITSLYKSSVCTSPVIPVPAKLVNYTQCDDSLIVLPAVKNENIPDFDKSTNKLDGKLSDKSETESVFKPDVSQNPSEETPRRKRKKTSGNKSDKKKPKKTELSEINEEELSGENKPKFEVQNVSLTFEDVGGNEVLFRELCRHFLHLQERSMFTSLGVNPSCGILLHGPPGCGKTLIGKAIAGHLGFPLLYITGPELVGSMSGESERRVREIFLTAQDHAPCILFIDEIDAVGQKRENASKEMERRITTQLMTSIDKVEKSILVVGATSKPDVLDPGLRRAGRFDKEVCVGIPNDGAREQILSVICKKIKLSEDVDLKMIAHLTPGFVGADLECLCREAADSAVIRSLADHFGEEHNFSGESKELIEFLKKKKTLSEDQMRNLSITARDFEVARKRIQPSSKREGFAIVPEVTWQDIGALDDIREELDIAIMAPVHNPQMFEKFGISRPCGILLAGPPGCGKTLVAKAVANQAGINFISVKGPELLNMYVGESEHAVRRCFKRARNSAPCVIFFDEFDSLCPPRSATENRASNRVVNQMLTELDGTEAREQVFVIAATNRPDVIDPAVLRPGRFDKTLFVGIPTPEDRVKILETITKKGSKPPISDEVSLRGLALDARCDGFTGADLSALVAEASRNAIKDCLKSFDFTQQNQSPAIKPLSQKYFDDAFTKVVPSVKSKDLLFYKKMQNKLSL